MTRKPLTKARIGVLMGGRSSEREISLRTGRAVHRALLRRGYRAVAIDVNGSLLKQLQVKRVEMVFLALHGPGGEDGTIQGFLETIGLPYTGSGVRASAMAMHKVTAKTLLACHGIPVPDGVVVRKASKWRAALMRAHRHDREAVVEAYIPGHEVTVSVLRGMRESRALPTIEIVAPGGFYDYAAKYTKGRCRYLCPAPLPAKVNRLVTDLAVRACDILGCDGAARVDFRVSPRGKPYVLEVNTIPGMTETSLLPMAAAKTGMDYDTLTEEILKSALRRAKAARC